MVKANGVCSLSCKILSNFSQVIIYLSQDFRNSSYVPFIESWLSIFSLDKFLLERSRFLILSISFLHRSLLCTIVLDLRSWSVSITCALHVSPRLLPSKVAAWRVNTVFIPRGLVARCLIVRRFWAHISRFFKKNTVLKHYCPNVQSRKNIFTTNQQLSIFGISFITVWKTTGVTSVLINGLTVT